MSPDKVHINGEYGHWLRIIHLLFASNLASFSAIFFMSGISFQSIVCGMYKWFLEWFICDIQRFLQTPVENSWLFILVCRECNHWVWEPHQLLSINPTVIQHNCLFQGFYYISDKSHKSGISNWWFVNNFYVIHQNFWNPLQM